MFPMTIPRRRLWFVLLAGLVLAGCVWAWILHAVYSTLIVERIAKGMTKAQVEAVMGCSPDFFSAPILEVSPENYSEIATWNMCDGLVAITFDINGKVIDRQVNNQGILSWQFHRLCAKLGI
jgi:hypothetical protein